MEQSFQYRKHIKLMARIMLFAGIPIGIALIAVGSMMDEYFLKILGILVFLESIVLPFFYRKLYTTELIINDDDITYRNVSNNITFAFEDILQVESRSIRYTGGWMILKVKNQKPIRITVVMQNLSEFIKRMKAALDERDMGFVYNEEKLKAFYLTSFYADYSWERSHYFMPKYLLTLLVQAIVITAIGVINHTMSGAYIALACILIGLIPYLYYEFGIYVKNIRKRAKTDGWYVEKPDSELAKERMNRAYFYYLVIGLIGIIIQSIISFM